MSSTIRIRPSPWLEAPAVPGLAIVGFEPDEAYVKEIAKDIKGGRICIVKKKKHADGEWKVELPCSVRNKIVFIVWRMEFVGNVNEDIMALFFLLDACESGGAEKIHVLSPYCPYSRSDKKDSPRGAIAVRWVKWMFDSFSALKHFVSLDLHSGQIVAMHGGIENLFMRNYVMDIIDRELFQGQTEEQLLTNFIFIAPDSSAGKATEKYSSRFRLPYTILQKVRDEDGQLLKSHYDMRPILRQQVNGRRGILIDDMASTLGTIRNALDLLKECGLQSLTIIVTHPILCKDSTWLDTEDLVDHVYVSDSVSLEKNPNPQTGKIRVYSTADILSKTIHCVFFGESLSEIYLK
jgi:ribose-phosphate pyrophosphokinase